MLSENMSIYVIAPDDAAPGVPVFLNSVLRESFDAGKSMPVMDEPWTNVPAGASGSLPKRMFLVSKDRKLSFDYYPFYNGFICSETFIKLIKEFNAEQDFEIISLTTVGWKGKSVTEKQYSYLHAKVQHKIVDNDKSVSVKHHYLARDEERILGDTGIKYYETIVFKELPLPSALFTVDDNLLSRYLFCSDEFMKRASAADCYGVEFVKMEDFGAYYLKKFYPNIYRQNSRNADYYLNKRNKKNPKP